MASEPGWHPRELEPSVFLFGDFVMKEQPLAAVVPF
jgi:hypothetical protein